MNVTATPTKPLRDIFRGLLLGTAVGDSLGLPAEGLSRERIRRRWNGEWDHRLFFGQGMWSDDAEHAFFVGQSLLMNPDNADAFARTLGWKLRWWLASVPAGVGLATLRSDVSTVVWLFFAKQRRFFRRQRSRHAKRADRRFLCRQRAKVKTNLSRHPPVSRTPIRARKSVPLITAHERRVGQFNRVPNQKSSKY